MDVMLGADYIYLFLRLDHNVEGLGLYLSYLTERYTIMGRMPSSIPAGRTRQSIPADRLATTPAATTPMPITSSTTRLLLPVIRQRWQRSASATGLASAIAQPSGQQSGAAQRATAPPTDVAPVASTPAWNNPRPVVLNQRLRRQQPAAQQPRQAPRGKKGASTATRTRVTARTFNRDRNMTRTEDKMTTTM